MLGLVPTFSKRTIALRVAVTASSKRPTAAYATPSVLRKEGLVPSLKATARPAISTTRGSTRKSSCSWVPGATLRCSTRACGTDSGGGSLRSTRQMTTSRRHSDRFPRYEFGMRTTDWSTLLCIRLSRRSARPASAVPLRNSPASIVAGFCRHHLSES